MNRGESFISIKELQGLMGTNWYNAAQRKHKAIRDKLGKGKRNLTIKEYCDHEDLPYRATYFSLRGEPPP